MEHTFEIQGREVTMTERDIKNVVDYYIGQTNKYNTFEYWKKEYINSLLLQNDNEKLVNMSDKEYKKIEQKVYDLCEHDEKLWEDIDYHVQKNIDNALEST